MKKKLSIVTVVSVILSLMAFVVLEAGPRGGGGGRGGSGAERRGGDGGNRSIQRSPSMSRTSRPSSETRPHENRANYTPSSNYSRSQANRPANRPNAASRPHTETKSQIQQFMKEKPAYHHQEQRPGIKPGEFPNKPNRPGNIGEQIKNRERFDNVGNNVRNHINSDYPHHRHDWFNHDFWDHHHYHPPYYHYNVNWWVPATAVGVGTWLGWKSQPYYYINYNDFGSGGDYWGPSDSYYSHSQPDYSQQYQEIESAQSNNTNEEWMPLGVFSLTKNSESPIAPNMFVQLALNKDGEISGTFYNATTDQTYELEGWVDPDSQRAAWKIADNNESPIVETGLYNLTEAEAPVRIYFPNGTSQDRLLVRLSIAGEVPLTMDTAVKKASLSLR